jgi:hypothetical protein
MDQDRSTMLAAMYQNTEPVNSHAPTINPTATRSRRIRVGAVEYEVPSLEYVQRLEQAMHRQDQMLRQQRILLDRVTALLTKSRTSQQGHSRAMDDLRREMTKKITLRDYS